MTCERVKVPGGYAVICARGSRAHKCRFCGRSAERQCDFPLKGRKAGATCDVFMCARCASQQGVKDGETIDYCPPHARLGAEPEQLELGSTERKR